MSSRMLGLLVGAAFLAAACGGNDAAPGTGADEPHASAVPPVEEEAAQMTPRASVSMQHMHTHAEQLDRLNAALAAGDLEAAGTPAYWLSKHETLAGLPQELAPYLERMRAEADIIEGTTDLATARAAATRLAASCKDCHRASED